LVVVCLNEWIVSSKQMKWYNISQHLIRVESTLKENPCFCVCRDLISGICQSYSPEWLHSFLRWKHSPTIWTAWCQKKKKEKKLFTNAPVRLSFFRAFLALEKAIHLWPITSKSGIFCQKHPAIFVLLFSSFDNRLNSEDSQNRNDLSTKVEAFETFTNSVIFLFLQISSIKLSLFVGFTPFTHSVALSLWSARNNESVHGGIGMLQTPVFPWTEENLVWAFPGAFSIKSVRCVMHQFSIDCSQFHSNIQWILKYCEKGDACQSGQTLFYLWNSDPPTPITTLVAWSTRLTKYVEWNCIRAFSEILWRASWSALGADLNWREQGWLMKFLRAVRNSRNIERKRHIR
jgi:hypothetical protein